MFIINLRLVKLKNDKAKPIPQWPLEAVRKNQYWQIKKEDFYNHSANAINKTGPLYFFWEVKEGISAQEFQKFIDGLLPGVGLEALINIFNPIDTSLINQKKHYVQLFS